MQLTETSIADTSERFNIIMPALLILKSPISIFHGVLASLSNFCIVTLSKQ